MTLPRLQGYEILHHSAVVPCPLKSVVSFFVSCSTLAVAVRVRVSRFTSRSIKCLFCWLKSVTLGRPLFLEEEEGVVVQDFLVGNSLCKPECIQLAYSFVTKLLRENLFLVKGNMVIFRVIFRVIFQKGYLIFLFHYC